MIQLKPAQAEDREALCYLSHGAARVAFTEGEYVIGRSPTCHMIVDDPVASRRHARLTVKSGIATIEDLDSNNGVFVNGLRVGSRPTTLDDGDRIIIGTEELTVSLTRESAFDDTEDVTVETVFKRPVIDPAIREKKPGREATSTGRVDALELLGNIADKALAMGHFEDADRVLGSHLRNVLEDAKAGKGVLPENQKLVSDYALKFANASKDGRWFDLVIELFDAEKTVCPDEIIIELQVALDKVADVDAEHIRRYLGTMEQVELDKDGTRSMQRIEELLTLAEQKQRTA